MSNIIHHAKDYERDSFTTPEFYEQGSIVAEVTGPNGHFVVVSDGDRALAHENGGPVLTDYLAFRAQFPTGDLPEDGDGWFWRSNGWWEVYEVIDGGFGAEGEVCDDLNEAIDCAKENAGYISSANLAEWDFDRILFYVGELEAQVSRLSKASVSGLGTITVTLDVVQAEIASNVLAVALNEVLSSGSSDAEWVEAVTDVHDEIVGALPKEDEAP